jgi:hypothetical protein
MFKIGYWDNNFLGQPLYPCWDLEWSFLAGGQFYLQSEVIFSFPETGHQ